MRNINYKQVEGHTSLIRDVSSNAIINTDDHEYEAYKLKKLQQIKQKREIESIKEEVTSLKLDLQEIKTLLHALVKGN